MNKKPTKESMLNLWATMGLLVKAVSNESWKKGKNNEKTYQAIRRLIESQSEVDKKFIENYGIKIIEWIDAEMNTPSGLYLSDVVRILTRILKEAGVRIKGESA
jgi:uncharacterized protein YpbB